MQNEMGFSDSALISNVAGFSPEASTCMDRVEDHEGWPVLSRIPMRLTCSIPVVNFKIRDLLKLAPGQTIHSQWTSTDDVPLKIGMVQISWSEFEVVEQRMALRMTRLA